MNPIERAEKIADVLWLNGVRSHLIPKQIVWIAAQIEEAQLEVLEQNEVIIKMRIEEAEREGYERARIDLNAIHSAKWKQEDYAEGFRAAREKAKGIIDESGPTPNPIDLAQRIGEIES